MLYELCNNSHYPIPHTANRSKGLLRHAKAASAAEHWIVCVAAGESLVNLSPLLLQLHHCPQPLIVGAEMRNSVILVRLQRNLLGLV